MFTKFLLMCPVKIWKNFPQTSFCLSLFQTLLLLQDPLSSVSGTAKHVTNQSLARHFLTVMLDEPVQWVRDILMEVIPLWKITHNYSWK